MINLLVFGAAGAAVVFVLIWAGSPGLREWIERPKYRFLEDVRRVDGEKRSAVRR